MSQLYNRTDINNSTLNISTSNSINQGHSRDIYQNSCLRHNSIQELCKELSSTETLDINVEKLLCEMAHDFIDYTIDSASIIAKNKKSNSVSVKDLARAVQQNFDLYEPGKYSKEINKIKCQQFKNESTEDHKKRMELSKEDTKNIIFTGE